MKTRIFTLSFVLVMLHLLSCSDKKQNTPDEPDIDTTPKTMVYVNLDPTDFSIANIFTPEGDSIYVYGDKNSEGDPTAMRDIIIYSHEEESETEIMFDSVGKPTKVIAPNGVVMLFEWLETNRAALTLIDPTTEEQLNTVIDFDQTSPMENPKIDNANSNLAKRHGGTKMSFVPIEDSKHQVNLSKRNAGSYSSKTGNLTIKQCNVETDAECWVDAYSYSGMPHSGLGSHVGRLKCVKKGNGQYDYILPYGVQGETHNLTEHCDVILNVLVGICSTSNTLGPAYKEAICTQISAYLASGIVSAPVALAFQAACTALNISLEIFCHTTPMQAAIYGDDLNVQFCDLLEEMHIVWTDPLVFVPIVNALPSYETGIPKEWDGKGPLPDLEVSWAGQPRINQFTLSPSAPARGQSYVATADLYCLSAGSVVTLSIIGTDGYADAKAYVVGDEINYRATLNVPGAESGVKDVCTVKLESPDGSVISKKASLIFQ